MFEEDDFNVDNIDLTFEDVILINLTDNIAKEKINVYKKTIL